MDNRSLSYLFLILVAVSAFLLLAGSISTTANTILCVSPSVNLVSWWPGDGDGGDLVGGNGGLLGEGIGFQAGMVVQAFSLDGIDDFVQVPDNGQGSNLDGFSQLTIDAWINPQSLGWSNPNTGGFTSAIVSKYDSSQPTGVSYYLNLENGKLRMAVFQSSNPVSMAGMESDDTVAIGAWSHIAGIWKGGTEIELYINGVQVSGTPFSEGQAPSLIANNGVPFNIGRIESFSGSYSGPGAYFHGLIDEVDIFDRALSLDEIQAIFNAGSEGKCKGDIVLTPTAISNSPNYLPVILKPLPTLTPTPTSIPTSTPTPVPTPGPYLHDGEYLANLGGGGSLWFTVSNNGRLASEAGYSFYHGAPWCGWSTHLFDGTIAINNGVFTFNEVLEDNHIPIYFATLECSSISFTRATCSARDWWIQFGPCTVTGTASLR